MTKRKKILLMVAFIFLLAFIVMFSNFKKAGIGRSTESYLNQYYQLRKEHPTIAKEVLELILKKEPTNQTALLELGYFYLQQGDNYQALPYFEKANQLYPNNVIIAFDYARILQSVKEFKKAKELFLFVYEHGDQSIKQQAKVILDHDFPITPILANSNTSENNFLEFNNTKTYLFSTYHAAEEIKAPEFHATLPQKNMILKKENAIDLMNNYYELNKTNKSLAWVQLQEIIKKYPNYVIALKEAGYILLNKKNNRQALPYFLQAYTLTNDPVIAMQIGYIYNGLGENHIAYKYFNLATRTNDQDLFLKAEIAMTNIRDAFPKFIKDPYFFEVYFDPFYFTRFDLMVYPVISRVGFVANKKHQLEVYTIYRRTTDNSSGVNNNIPQIFEDNAQITDFGFRLNPIPEWPIVYFIEMGAAKDLIYENRPRWRSDFRTGLAMFQPWGKEATFTLHPEFPFKQVGDAYADIIYYSRYQDVIATARVREGFRAFEYQCMMLDFYLKGFLVGDTLHQFYNNIFEIGPGIALTPVNKFNFVVRYETIQGYYLPVNSPSRNPYGPKYRNSITQADFFIRF